MTYFSFTFHFTLALLYFTLLQLYFSFNFSLPMQVVRLGVQLLYGPQVATAAEGVLGTYPLSQTTVHLS